MVSVREGHRPVTRPGAYTPGTRPGTDATAGELVSQAARQISELVHQELALAKAELAEKGRDAGRGAGLFGAAGTVAFYGGATLVGAAVAALAIVWPTWAAALVVGMVLLIVAGVLALTGRKQLRRAVPPAPEQAIESVKADAREIREHLRERHSR
jgi:MFS family permease